MDDPISVDDFVPLSELHQAIYTGVERVIMPQLRSAQAGAQSSLVRARMMRLRQAAVNPALLLRPLEEEGLLDLGGNAFSSSELEIAELVARFEPSRDLLRLSHVVDLARDILAKQRKVVIWSYFLGNLQLLMSEFSGTADFVEVLIPTAPRFDSRGFPRAA